MLEKEKLLKYGFKEAKEITKKHAKTFYLASFFLKRKERLASYSVYAICRISDDCVDLKEKAKAEGEILIIEKSIDSAYSEDELKNALLLAFRKTVKEYKIPKDYFDELISGMKMDLTVKRYDNFSQLYDYCYKVAGVIGLILLKIFRAENENAKKYAVSLGIAMQLTNILRDIKEDYHKGRIYLPLDEIKEYGLKEDDFAKEKSSLSLVPLLKFQTERAKKYYRESRLGIKEIENRRFKLVILLMSDLYSAILEKIEAVNYDVFLRRIYLNHFRRLLIIIKTLVRGEYL